MSKAYALRKLADQRKRDRRPPHRNFSDFHDGAYDLHHYVVPWTISAHNYDSHVMIIGQDWNSEANLAGVFDREQQRYGQKRELQTNINLKILLSNHLNILFEETYATDLFVFAKPGNMSARIPIGDLLYCCHTYCLPQIRIVNPRVAICIGALTYNIVAKAINRQHRWRRISEADRMQYGDTAIFGVTHTGGIAFNRAGRFEGVAPQWDRVRAELLKLRTGFITG